MGVRLSSRPDRPGRSFLKLFKPHERHRPATEYAKHKRVERTENPGMVGGLDRGGRIARLRLYESQRIMPEREVRAQMYRLLEVVDRRIMPAKEPLRAPHRPVRCGIEFIGQQRAPGVLQGRRDRLFAIPPMLERVLPMGEGKSAWARAKVGSSLAAFSKKLRAASFSARVNRYMCHRPRW